jgi:hypothetical protein
MIMHTIEDKPLREGAKDKVMEETTWHQMLPSIVIEFDYNEKSSMNK